MASNHGIAGKTYTCCICREAMNESDIATLSSCSHSYHLDCIKAWSHIENACPLCKQRFTAIITRNGTMSVSVDKKDQAPAYHVELGNIIWVEWACTLCGSDDSEELLLLCDGCDSATHTYCAGLGDEVPNGEFYCDACRARFSDLSKEEKLDSDSDYVPSPQRHTASGTTGSRRFAGQEASFQEIKLRKETFQEIKMRQELLIQLAENKITVHQYTQRIKQSNMKLLKVMKANS